MQLDGAQITIERRKTAGCLDLAVVFQREHFARIAVMTGWFAVPTIIIGWLLMSYVDAMASWMVLLLFSCVSPFLGAALVNATGRRVFGDDFEPGEAVRGVGRHFSRLLGYVLLTRFISAIFGCFILPPLFIICRWGFMTEILYLENAPKKKAGVRLKNLMASVYSDLVGRALILTFFYAVFVFGFFVLVELFCTVILGFSILWDRLDLLEGNYANLLLFDPLVSTVIHGLLWAFYPLVRVAWFFCYLDVRIQKEGWDVELDFRIEAQRLEALT